MFVVNVIFIILLPPSGFRITLLRYSTMMDMMMKLIARDKLQYERTGAHDEYHRSEDNVRGPCVLGKGWMQ